MQSSLTQAMQLHQTGKLAEAEPFYRQVLAADAGNFQAQYLFAVLCYQQQRIPEALQAVKAALKLNAASVQALLLQGVLLQAIGRPLEALDSLSQATALRPDHAEAWYHRGVTLCDLKHFEEALASYDKALAIRPDDAEALYNRGHALQDLKRFEEAVISYDNALAIMPDNFHALCNRGVALAELNRFPEALENYDKTLAIRPDYAEALYNRGFALSELKRHEEAVADYEKALEIRPDFVEAMGNRAIALQYLKRFEDALASFDRAITADPGHVKSHLDKGFCKLLMGQFEEGWHLHEWRKRLPESGAYRAYPQPVWSGAEDLTGKTLYVYAEQALGDTILFCRYAALAEARGAKVFLSVQNALVRLMKSLSPTIAIHALNTAPSDFDYHIPLLSMPLAFKTDQNNFPAKVPYLRAEPERAQSWARRIGSDGFRIGIAWQAGKYAKAHAGRSFPLRYFENLSKIPGVRLISLQKNTGAEQLLDIPSGMKVETLGDGFDEGPDAFVDAAAVMENLDLIITPCTSVAHLAGALGRPVWVALKYLPDWRWFLDRSNSPWYPTMRLFRQQVDGDWAPVFAQIESQLAPLAESK